MSDKKEPRTPDVPDDRDIRSLMRESDYTEKAREEFKRTLLREINHNFEYHRSRTRMLVAAVVVVLGSLAAVMKVTDVGSDGASLLKTGARVDGKEVVEAPFTGERFSVATEAGEAADLAETEELYAKIVAGELILEELDAWTIDGETSFGLVYALPGQDEQRLMRRSGGTQENAVVLRRFLREYGKDFLDGVDSGVAQPEARDTVSYRGLEVPMYRWSWDVPGYGTVEYRRSVPRPLAGATSGDR